MKKYSSQPVGREPAVSPARGGMRASYPTPVPEDAGLGLGDYYQTCVGYSVPRHSPDSAHLAPVDGLESQLLSPGNTATYSPSMASDEVHEGISPPAFHEVPAGYALMNSHGAFGYDLGQQSGRQYGGLGAMGGFGSSLMPVAANSHNEGVLMAAYGFGGAEGLEAGFLASQRSMQIPRAALERPPGLRMDSLPTSDDRHDKNAFPCLYQFAGCLSSFPGKNEWKRHVNTIHVRDESWICTKGDCLLVDIVAFHEARLCSAGYPERGRVFNRKDLYLSHLNRAHPQLLPGKPTQASRRWQSAVPERLAEEAFYRRVSLPSEMLCPFSSCAEAFHGAMAWDDFLEHVADHQKRALARPSITMHVGEQSLLMQWSVAAGFLVHLPPATWELHDAVKHNERAVNKKKTAGAKRTYDEEADWGLSRGR
ncbi:hypothetical protein CDD81_7221 [Ophiocordyceps australis]|uniref:C2H2-type domain-containing protein n=1 Tax=Ophiocordyceps australis TaxID=1399860 RepID=A0A2C5X938_9HYPO|nr:hypothetical protein CDD81_7221 [Ophiocordyceps australis]